MLATGHNKILAVQVVVPGTYMEYTSRRVLTSTWIDGEKLSQSKADNVAELVNVGVVAYLHQLLDIGVALHLHCCRATSHSKQKGQHAWRMSGIAGSA